MKLYNPFKVADEAYNPVLMLSIIVTFTLTLVGSVILLGPYSFIVLFIIAFARVLYALFKGE